MYYTYAHISSKTGNIFYYGKGMNNRAYCKQNRSKKWHEFANSGYQVEILAKWSSEKEALDHERFLIWCARDMNQEIVNITSGGQGCSGNQNWLGKKHKEESKQKIKLGNLGKKRRFSKKFSEANAGIKNPRWKGYWVTPDGKFDTLEKASKHFCIDSKTIRARCLGYKEQLVNELKSYPPKDGWSFEPKEQ